MKFWEFLKNNKYYLISIGISVLFFLLTTVGIVCFFVFRSVPAGVVENEETVTENKPEETEEPEKEEERVFVPFERRSNGIDVSKWQGEIDWKKVKESGVYFAFIRIGLRGEDGKIYEDERAAYNLYHAQENGVLVGVYFFSTAVDEAEAVEEADWVLNYIEGHSISYPVVYDCEGFYDPKSRMYELTAEERTKNALAFLDKVSEAGYDTMHYGARNELNNKNYWDTELIATRHKIWVAMYTNIVYPYKDRPTYNGRCDAWQFSNKGVIPGIDYDVDLVVCYFLSDKALPKDPEKAPDRPKDPVDNEQAVLDEFCGMKFYAHKDKVTAKILVNLRSTPEITEDNVVGSLEKGVFVDRIAISDQGWSRLNYNGESVYAVTSYLTVESSAETSVTESNEQYYFDDVSDEVTAKIETNLRNAPTTSGSDIVYTLKNGEYIKRTGVNYATGWSRLEYNGVEVYAISSYLTVKDSVD